MTDIDDSVLRARLQLMLRYPFLASAVARLPLIRMPEDSWCPTAATDGYHIFWNPDFFSNLKEEEITGVLAHEVLHVALGHIDRRGNRDARIWNEAIDHAANLLLLGYDVVLPRPRLADYRFRDMPAETIYEELLRRKATPRNATTKPSTLRLQRIGRRRNAAGENKVALAESVPSSFDIHVTPDDPRLEGLALSSSRPSPLELGRLRHELMRDISTELARSNGYGTLPGELTEAIVRAGRSTVPWQALLARCFTGMRRDDYRLLPPSRRHIWRGLYLPSVGVPGPRLVVCAIDTSGSVDTALARRFLTEVHGLRSTAQCRLHVVQCDTRITQVNTYESWETPDPLKPEQFSGRGGTDFRPVFDWIRGKVLPLEGWPDLLAYLTDGQGPFPEYLPAYPVAWLLPQTARAAPPFGMKIEIPAH